MDLRVGMALRGFSIQEYHNSAEKTENKFKSSHELVKNWGCVSDSSALSSASQFLQGNHLFCI